MPASQLSKLFNLQYVMPVAIKVMKVTQNDWVNIGKTGLIVKGVLSADLNISGVSGSVQETNTYGPGIINNTGTPYGTTDSVIAVNGMLADGVNPRITPYLIATSSGEILEVTADSAPLAAAANLTVKRGRYGTTATGTGLANGNHISILNQLVLTSATVGLVTGIVQPIGDDSGINAFV
jgi:hypothetical protein